MNQEELKQVMRYAPYLMFDEKEPFDVWGIGCTIFTETAPSDSFPRVIRLEKSKTAFVIEYAICFYYDIQHLYELEHVWVSVDHEGRVCGCEGSYHGKYLNEMLPGGDIVRDQTHVCLFSQPGKHALLPEKRLLYLYPDLTAACTELAGADGFAYPEHLYGVSVSASQEDQELVRNYIQKHFRFAPTMNFVEKRFLPQRFRSWSTLKKEIPEIMREELEKIRTESRAY